MSCCSVAFCGFVVHGSVYGVLGYCRLFGLGVISFFIIKNIAVLPFGFLRNVGQARERLQWRGFVPFGFGVLDKQLAVP
jgi:hypothetical protein